MQIKNPVLIVGAGPTGLTMACVLQRYGIPVRIIDKKAERTQTSNALGLHARTLRLLDDLGIAAPFLDLGKPLTNAEIHSNDHLFAKINLSVIQSRYAYVLILPQCQTEQILEQHLNQHGITVERDTALIHIEKKNSNYQLALRHPDKTEECSATYVIACDGGHSTVRNLVNVPFEGAEIPNQFILADATVAMDFTTKGLNAFYADDGILAIFPLPNGEVRLIADIAEQKNIGHNSDDIMRAMQEITEKRACHKIRILKSSWTSSFWIHSKYVKNMRHDNIFFCGDAAHIHSPVGGQGMNTGMQDAYNLGWKLAMVLQGTADPKILDSFNQERLPVIKGIVKQTDSLTRALLAKSFFTRFVRRWVMKPLLQSKKLNKKIATHLAMLDTQYTDSAVIHYTSCISNRSPQAGDLIPEIPLSGKNFWLLIFTGENPKKDTIEPIKQCINIINSEYPESINCCVVTTQELTVPATQINDSGAFIHKQFNVNQPALCLVRPDKYIAYCNAKLDIEDLQKYLKTFLL